MVGVGHIIWPTQFHGQIILQSSQILLIQKLKLVSNQVHLLELVQIKVLLLHVQFEGLHVESQLLTNHLFTLFGELFLARIDLLPRMLKDRLDCAVGALVRILAKVVHKLFKFGPRLYQGLPFNLRLFLLQGLLSVNSCRADLISAGLRF